MLEVGSGASSNPRSPRLAPRATAAPATSPQLPRKNFARRLAFGFPPARPRAPSPTPSPPPPPTPHRHKNQPAVSIRNTKNILFKNLMDVSFSTVCFYLVGYAFLYGGNSSFIGGTAFALQSRAFHGSDRSDDAEALRGVNYAKFVYAFAFAATATTIVSGAVAERFRFKAYAVYGACITGFIYPVVAHWAWSDDGWASAMRSKSNGLLFSSGVVDYAGSAVVHVTGGLAALLACVAVGPRVGRFNGNHLVEMPYQSPVFQTLGTYIMWFCWYGFNCVASTSLSGGKGVLAGRSAVNTTIAAAFGGAVTMLMDSYAKHQKLEPRRMNNGILCGLVSISGSAGLIEPHYAVIVGSVAGIVYPTASKILLHKFKVDDVVDAVPVHLGGGVWGLLAASLFTSSRAYLTKYDSYVDDGETPCGLFMGCANSGAILGSNFVFLLAQVSWVVVTCSIVLYVIKRQIGLRVNLDDEVKGLDQSQHGGRSYTEFQTTVFKFKTASGAEHSMEMRVRAGDAAKFAMALSEVMEGAAGGVADVGPDDSVKGAKISRVFINNQPVESESESDYGSSQHSKGSRGESLRAASVFAQMGIQPVPTSSSAGAGGDVVLNMPPSALKPVREEWRSSPDDSPSRDEAEMKKKKKREKRSDGRGRNGVPLDPFADAQNAV